MREIKFRGKRIYNGDWVHGWYVGHSEALGYIHRGYIDKDEVWSVDAETVGQYTGLKDKNGVEIYEHDVVWYRAGEHYRGIWEYERQYTVDFGWSEAMWDMLQCDEIEVVGNIHDNPELINKEV